LLPAVGEYCDIISECKQKITISGGKGFFKPQSSDEPVGEVIFDCIENTVYSEPVFVKVYGALV
jgi:hypothetical protein